MVISLVLMLVISFGSFFATILAGWAPKLGLDLAGGVQLVLTPANSQTISDSQLHQAQSIIRKRVDGLGVSGATVQIQGKQIIVQIPGVKNGREVQAKLVTTAQLYFRPVECFANAYTPATGTQKEGNPRKLPQCGAPYQLSQANLQVTPNQNSPSGFDANNIGPDPQYDHTKSTTAFKDLKKEFVLLPGLATAGPTRYFMIPAVMTGEAVSSASVGQDAAGAWTVNCTLTPAGSALWDQVSKTFFHEYMGIELDGVVESAPIIQPTQSQWTSFGGQVSISGSLTQADANTLATALQYGSLPVPLTVLTSETVSPTLGHAALVAGLGAGLAGLALVLLYVILYYRMLGMVVIMGLAITAAILWALISALGQTSVAPSFDLAGVTGLIVSIGITVDSYIVYFERLKDETRSGRSVRTSLDRGFASAWRTVLAADTVSLLAAVLLYFLAIGSVRGFAFFLGLSTLLDIIVTWFFTRPAVSLLGRNDRLTSMRGLGIARGLGVTPAARP
jgi:preprotein translocase subunit SecD